MVAGLVLAGLTTVVTESIRAPDLTMKVERYSSQLRAGERSKVDRAQTLAMPCPRYKFGQLARLQAVARRGEAADRAC